MNGKNGGSIDRLQWGTYNSSSVKPNFTKFSQFLDIFRNFQPIFGKKNWQYLPKNPGLMSYALDELYHRILH